MWEKVTPRLPLILQAKASRGVDMCSCMYTDFFVCDIPEGRRSTFVGLGGGFGGRIVKNITSGDKKNVYKV